MTATKQPMGYNHSLYALSLKEFGEPRELPLCGGWILERKIPDTPYRDAIGCYPLFVCKDWSQIANDFENMGADWISVTLVADPFGNYDETLLHQCFRDLVIPFKNHFIADLQRPQNEIVSKHHRYYARKSLKNLIVEKTETPQDYVDEWVGLYRNISNKYNLTGMKAFSRDSFAKQLSIPEITMFRAICQNEVVGAQLWTIQGEVGYSHLTAISDKGYDLRASYAIYWYAIEYFRQRLRWLDLGAGAGLNSNEKDGLSEFKRGWSTDVRTAYLCGRINDREKYFGIATAKGLNGDDYFPAYRKGEFD